MEATEKRTKHFKDEGHVPMENGEARVIQLGLTHSTCGGEDEDVKNIQTGRKRRRRKQSVIVERNDGEYR